MNDSTEKKAKVKTVAEDMPQRSMFDTPELASAFLNRMAEEISDFGDVQMATRGLTDDGDFDTEVYTDDMQVMVSVLKNRAPKGSNLPSTVKCIVITPAPKVDAILADPEGKSWLYDIIAKELNHVAVRKLREADDITSVLDQMPTTLKGYVTSGRESGGIMESFDETFKGIKDTLDEKVAVWAKARLTKGELKKALESAAYAREYYPLLEDRGEKPSLFVMAAQLGVKVCEERGLNPAIYNRWLETRNEKTITVDEDEDDFTLEDLVESMAKPEASAEGGEQPSA